MSLSPDIERRAARFDNPANWAPVRKPAPRDELVTLLRASIAAFNSGAVAIHSLSGTPANDTDPDDGEGDWDGDDERETLADREWDLGFHGDPLTDGDDR